MRPVLGGIDIGGTKCAVSLGSLDQAGESIDMLGKRSFPTPKDPDSALKLMIHELKGLMRDASLGEESLRSIGVSCGGPLNSRTGLILSPPNLPGWDRVDVYSPIRERFGVPVGLQNDANACALAEWLWGAGRGCRNMIFLTFGTGMGAGLILDGKLYEGVNDRAGEVGHVRMDQAGPVGYGKKGSFEGYCSGGGIVRLARQRVYDALMVNNPPYWCSSFEQMEDISAKAVFDAARSGERIALDIVETVGMKLGQGLAILIDVLNPERIVIGSIYSRQEDLLRPAVMRELGKEALPESLSACQIVPSALGENVGDWAALSIARYVIA